MYVHFLEIKISKAVSFNNVPTLYHAAHLHIISASGSSKTDNSSRPSDAYISQ